jgi:hypothetical protein
MKRYLTSILMLGSACTLVLFLYYFRRCILDCMMCSALVGMPSAKETSGQLGSDGYISFGLSIVFAIAGIALFITAVRVSSFWSKSIDVRES